MSKEISPQEYRYPWDREVNFVSGFEDENILEKVNVKNIFLSPIADISSIMKCIANKANLMISYEPIISSTLIKNNLEILVHKIRLLSSYRITFCSLGSSWLNAPGGGNHILGKALGIENLQSKRVLTEDLKPIYITIGKLQSASIIREIIKTLAFKTGFKMFEIFGTSKSSVTRIGILAGILENLKIFNALTKENIDLLIVGEIPYEMAMYGVDMKINILKVGYIDSLIPGLRYLKNLLQLKFKDIKVIISEKNEKYERVYFE